MKHSQKLRTKRPAILATGIATLFIALSSALSPAAVTYVGDAIINGTQIDQSGLPATVLADGASTQNALNGIGSGFAYAGGNLFSALCDRGPNKVTYSGGVGVDYTQNYDCRTQQFTLSLTPVGSPDGFGHFASYTVGAKNVGTTLLKNGSGAQYVGISSAYTNGTRLDPESVRVAPDGTFWITDEYGPFILHFNRLGQQIGSLTLPAGFQIANPDSVGTNEIANNTTGRVNNKGMEGVALTPDGKKLVGIMQSPLIQDGGTSGLNVRIVVYDLTNPFCGPKQYLYQLDSTATANSEILAISNHSFLIDERDSAAGNSGKKLLYKVDFNQATPPTDLATTAYSGTTASNGMSPSNGVALNGTPTGVVPLAKTLFADVGAKLVAAGAFTTDATNFRTDLPDKIEGYTWGPDLPDGRHVLLATNDNDYAQPASTPGGAITGKGFPNYIFAFAVDPSDVPEFQAPTFDTDALSTIQHIVVIYQENWSFDGLYGSFPGANGIASASTASKAQIDRLTAAALSTEAGTFNFNRISQTGNTPNLPLVQTSNANSNPGTLNTPPQPLGSAGGTAANNPTIVDTRFLTNPADPNSALNVNTLLPFPLSTDLDPTQLTGDIVHRYWHEQFQIFGSDVSDTDHGNNSGFITWSDNPGLVMSSFDGTSLPEGLLAQQYTMCDNFFHSAFGGSFLNHQLLVAAAAPVYDNMPTSNNGNIAYVDSTGLLVMNTSGPSAGKQVQDGSITPVGGETLTVTLNGNAGTVVTAGNVAFADGSTFDKHYAVNTIRSKNLTGNGESPTAASTLPSLNDSNPTNTGGDTRPYELNIGDKLSAADVSWKWYSGGFAQILAYSGSNPSPTTNPSYSSVNATQQFQYHHQPLAYFDNYAPFDTMNTVPPAFVGGFAGTGTGGLTAGRSGVTRQQNSNAHLQDEANFFTDVLNGTLPAVSFIKPVGVNNEHPGYATLQQGQAHVASIIQALQANSSLWANTLIIITYDEHGGRWDHVTPPTRDIWGPGVRVPAIVISPVAKQGLVDHTQRDTSSILSTIEARFGLSPLNGRDGNAPSFANVLSTLGINRGTFAVNRRANSMSQGVTITNLASTPIVGPVQLALDNLTAGTTLTNRTGITANNPPTGSPYITVTAGTLAPGASITVPLQFTIPASGGVNYTARTVVGTSNP